VRERPADVPAVPGPEGLLTEMLESFDGRVVRANVDPAGREFEDEVLRLVESWSMSLPCTTRLSLDLFSSSCNVSAMGALLIHEKGGGKVQSEDIRCS